MISIDVFDTALFNKLCSYEDILREINNEEFFIKRKEIEIKLKEKNFYFNLDDIYEILIDYDKNVEIEALIRNSVANPKILKVYNGSPNKFIFIEDSYFPKEVLERVLVSVGYKSPRVFTSNELKLNKIDGSLYKEVENIIKEKISVNYGDNYEEDIEGSKLVGIKGVYNPSIKDINIPLNISIKDPYLKKYILVSLLDKDESNLDLNVINKIAKLLVPILLSFLKSTLTPDKEVKRYIFKGNLVYLPYMITRDILKLNNLEFIYSCNNKEYIKSFKITKKDVIIDSETLVNYLEEGISNIDLFTLLLTPNIDIVEGYRDGELIFKRDISKKKYLSRLLEQVIKIKLEDKDLIERKFVKADIKNLALFLQEMCPDEFLFLYNQPLTYEGEIKTSIINYNREGIKAGMLRELYEASKAKNLFLRMLRNDKELYTLEKYLTDYKNNDIL